MYRESASKINGKKHFWNRMRICLFRKLTSYSTVECRLNKLSSNKLNVAPLPLLISLQFLTKNGYHCGL